MIESDGWDVWVITTHRDASTISRFLAEFVDRAAAEDRGEEQLMLAPLDRSSADFAITSTTPSGDIARRFEASFDWEPAVTLTHSIERGLARPWRAFGIFGLPSSRPDLMSAAIEFTPDGELVLGVEARTSEEAAAWLIRLATDFDADLGLVSGSVPQSQARAEELIATGRAHHQWRRQPGTESARSSRPPIS